MQKFSMVMMVANAVLWPLVGILSLWRARLEKRKSYLLRGISYIVAGIGWGFTARWPDAWAWGIPLWMLVVVLALEIEDWVDKVDRLEKKKSSNES